MFGKPSDHNKARSDTGRLKNILAVTFIGTIGYLYVVLLVIVAVDQ